MKLGAKAFWPLTIPNTVNDTIKVWMSSNLTDGFWANYAGLVGANPADQALMLTEQPGWGTERISAQHVVERTLGLEKSIKSTQIAWFRLKVLIVGMALSEECFAVLQTVTRILQC